MTKIVTVGCYGSGGASSRVRMFDWVDHLGLESERHNYVNTSSVRPLRVGRHPIRVLRAEADLRRLVGSRVDRLLLSRVATPFSHGGVEAALLRSAKHGVLDIDDGLMWDRRPWTDPAVLFPKPTQVTRAAQAADVVIAGNEDLLYWAKGLTESAVYIPSCVEPADYLTPTDYEIGSVPLIVWLGSPATEPFLELIEGALIEVHARTGAQIVIISAGSRSLGRLDAIVHRKEWSESTVASDLSTAHVAIAPMPDSPFNRGKCAYKILQYGASALPIVVSPVGANAVAADRLAARTATSTDEWVAELMSAIESSPTDRRRAGERARSGVMAHYSFDAWTPAWKAALDIG